MRIQRTIRESNHRGEYACAGGQCPGLLLTDENEVLIQGGLVMDSEKSTLSLPRDEDVVRMPRSVFDNLLEQYRKLA